MDISSSVLSGSERLLRFRRSRDPWVGVKTKGSEEWAGKLTAMHPAVFDGVTKREERNGGAYSNTKRLTISNTKMLLPGQPVINVSSMK